MIDARRSRTLGKAAQTTLPFAALLLLAPGCRDSRPPTRLPPKTPTSTSIQQTLPATIPIGRVRGPMAFFHQSCVRCHGIAGELYPETLAQTNEKKLRADVVRMVIGPAQTTLAPAEVEAQIAFHRSLVDHAPFLAVTETSRTTIRGETTPGSIVHAMLGDTRIDAVVDGWTWRITLPRERTPADVITLHATKDGRTSICAAEPGATSHQAPLPR